MRYRAIQEHDRRYLIRLMRRALAVSSPGSYAWRGRPEGRRAVANCPLLATIRLLHPEQSADLRQSQHLASSPRTEPPDWGHRVARLMHHAGLRAKTVKKWWATTYSSHRFPVAANTFQRRFTVSKPNRVWAGDITDVRTLEGCCIRPCCGICTRVPSSAGQWARA